MTKAKVFGILASAILAAGAVVPAAAAWNTVSVSAAASTSKPAIDKIFYSGSGKVEVDFASNVQYKNLKITAVDSTGKSYTATVLSKDSDDVKFKINKYKAGRTYTVTISGVRVKGTSTYTTVTDKVKLSSANTTAVVEKTTYKGSGKVELEFQSYVKYKNVKITATDNYGATYATTITEKDNDELTFKIKNYKTGRTYTYKITGIAPKGATVYKTVTGKVKIAASSSSAITLAKAKSIALNHAGLTASQVTFTTAKPDYDDGVKVYEIEFRKGNWEYEYEIKASNGKILSWDKDYDD